MRQTVRRGAEQHSAVRDHLIVRTHVEQLQSVVENADEERAGERAPDGAAAAKEARAADDDGGHRVEFVEFARTRVAGIQARGDEHAGESGAQTANHIHLHEHAIDADAR